MKWPTAAREKDVLGSPQGIHLYKTAIAAPIAEKGFCIIIDIDINYYLCAQHTRASAPCSTVKITHERHKYNDDDDDDAECN